MKSDSASTESAATRSIFSCTNLLLTLETVLVSVRELTMHWSSGLSNALYIMNWLIQLTILLHVLHHRYVECVFLVCGTLSAGRRNRMTNRKCVSAWNFTVQCLPSQRLNFELQWRCEQWICWDLILNHKLFIDDDRIDITLILMERSTRLTVIDL